VVDIHSEESHGLACLTPTMQCEFRVIFCSWCWMVFELFSSNS